MLIKCCAVCIVHGSENIVEVISNVLYYMEIISGAILTTDTEIHVVVTRQAATD